MTPRVYVDFNEMISSDEVLLSRSDTKSDSHGKVVRFTEGLSVAVYMDDQDEHGNPDNLIADGVAMRNTSSEWGASVPWVLKIDSRGIRHQSEEPDA